MAKTATIGDDIVKTKPELKPLWDQLRAAVECTVTFRSGGSFAFAGTVWQRRICSWSTG
jgi:hypothetical protein